MEVHRILVALDFSRHSERALDWAADLARRLGASLDLVHAYHVALPMGPPAQVAVPPRFWSDLRDAAEAQLERAAARLHERGLECTSHLSPLPPARAIVETADRIGADLIVMGTRGATGLEHVLLGSVAERTVRAAHCPVLTVKGDAAA